MSEEIHIVINRLDISDDYNRHAGSTMVSVLEHCSQKVVFHLTYELNSNPKQAEENIIKYQKLVSKYNASIEFHDLEYYKWDIQLPKNIVDTWSSVCLSRVHFQELFPNLDQLILLGSDVIVHADLAKIISTYGRNQSIIATQDLGFTNQIQQVSSAKVANPNFNTYFNADVLIYNLKKIREENKIIEKAVEYLKKVPNPTYNEQDVLNYVFKDDVCILPRNYGIIPFISSDIQKILSNNDDFIIHYAGPIKPWDCYSGIIDNWYWDALLKTPWCTDIYNFYEYIRNAPDMGVCKQKLSSKYLLYINGSDIMKLKDAAKFIILIELCVLKGFGRTIKRFFHLGDSK